MEYLTKENFKPVFGSPDYFVVCFSKYDVHVVAIILYDGDHFTGTDIPQIHLQIDYTGYKDTSITVCGGVDVVNDWKNDFQTKMCILVNSVITSYLYAMHNDKMIPEIVPAINV